MFAAGFTSCAGKIRKIKKYIFKGYFQAVLEMMTSRLHI